MKNKLIYILLILTICTRSDVIKIPPVTIESKIKKSPDSTTTILANLKRAVVKNQKSQKLSKEEEAKIILENLKKRVSTQTTTVIERKTEKQKKSIKKKIAPVKRKSKIQIVKKNIKKRIAPVKRKSKVQIVKKNIKKRIAPVKRKPKVQIVKKNIQQEIVSDSPQPIGFVKTLGIVSKSEVYEVNDVVIEKREEVTNDGVVDIPTATTDTLENLPFVKPLEVIEVTEPFEATEARKYQLDKR